MFFYYLLYLPSVDKSDDSVDSIYRGNIVCDIVRGLPSRLEREIGYGVFLPHGGSKPLWSRPTADDHGHDDFRIIWAQLVSFKKLYII